MAKKVNPDFKDRPLEYGVRVALETMDANDKDHGLTTDELATTLMELGYPASDRVRLCQELRGLARQKQTKEGFLRPAPEGASYSAEQWFGSTWIGARVHYEPWNEHLWYLPLWKPTTLVNV